MTRYALLTRDGEPMLWDFGSAAKHHQLYSHWLRPTRTATPGMLGLRGAVAPTVGPDGERGPPDQGPAGGRRRGRRAGRRRHRRAAVPVRDAAPGADGRRRPAADARRAADQVADEIMLLNQAAAMVDGVYQDIVDALQARRPRERDRRARQQAALRDGLRPGRGDQRGLAASGATRTRTTSPTG